MSFDHSSVFAIWRKTLRSSFLASIVSFAFWMFVLFLVKAISNCTLRGLFTGLFLLANDYCKAFLFTPNTLKLDVVKNIVMLVMVIVNYSTYSIYLQLLYLHAVPSILELPTLSTAVVSSICWTSCSICPHSISEITGYWLI